MMTTTFIFFSILIASVLSSFELPFHGEFNPAHSFSAPFDDEVIPGWEIGDAAMVLNSGLRLTPDATSRRGWAWSNIPNTMRAWEAEFEFVVGDGSGVITGADGFAFFYADKKSESGPVFGAPDFWNGLAVVFDSFDNDGNGDAPKIQVILNDGTKAYQHETDASEQESDSCNINFRALGSSRSARARVVYDEHRNLRVWVDLDPNNNLWQQCAYVPNVFLPPGKHFGLAAGTGGISDLHEIYRFETFSLYPDDPIPSAPIGAPTKPAGIVMSDEKDEGLLSGFKKWFSGDEDAKSIERTIDPSNPRSRSFQDLMDLVQQKETEVKKNRLSQLSSLEQVEEYNRDARFNEIQNEIHHFRDSEDSKPVTGNTNPTPFTTSDQLAIRHLQDVVILQTRVLGEIMDAVSIAASRDDIQALHAAFLEIYGSKISDIHSSLDKLHTNVKETQQGLKTRHETTEQIAGTQERILKRMDYKNRELQENIKKDSNFTFWFIFIIFQAIFFFSFVVYNKQKEEMQKKMY